MPNYIDYKFTNIKAGNGQTTVGIRVYKGNYVDRLNEYTGEMENVYERYEMFLEREVVLQGEYTEEQLVILINTELGKIKGKGSPLPIQTNA